MDTLLNAKEKLGAWKYKDDHDHHLVRAVCVQIKGEIQASLGQWVIAASLLLESIHLFRTLPKVDKKGLSCSLGLLVNTLQSMSVEEYQYIATKHSLVSPHPYLEAHVFAREAAQLAVFTPLFLARHKVSTKSIIKLFLFTMFLVFLPLLLTIVFTCTISSMI